MKTTTVALKTPLILDNTEVTEICLRAYKAGDAAKARAFIIRHKAYGPDCVNNQLVLNLAVLRYVVLPPPQVLSFPPNWAEELTGSDFSNVVDHLEALTQGFENVEAYRAHVQELIKDAENKLAEAANKPFLG